MYDQVAEAQHGLITYQQLLGAGMTRREIEGLVERHVMHRYRRGVFRVAGAPMTLEAPVLAACLAAGPFVLGGMRSAAVILGLSGFVAKRVELLAWGGSHPRLAGVTVHRTIDLPEHHRTIVRGVPVTTAARTFVDLAPTRAAVALGRSLDHARRHGLVNLAAVVEAAEGRRDMAVLRSLLDKRLHDRSDSDFEAHVYWLLSEAGLPLPVQQLQVAVPEGVYLLDHGWPEPLKIDLEMKGFDHEVDRTMFDRDTFRKAHLRRAGWVGLEITTAWSDRAIVTETEAILRERGWDRAA